MFNKDYHYPYIIFCYQALSTEYKELVSSLTQSDVVFEKVSDADYGYTNTTDKFRAELARKYLRDTQDNTLEFRFKSRLMAGTIFNHPRLSELDYFWRFEPGTEYMCPIDSDPFQYMYDHGKQVSFSIATYENHETIPTLFKSVSKFKQQNPQFKYMSADQGDNSIMSNMLNNGKYNRCFFWNSFQIASTRFFKSPEYTAYFKFLDAQEGIFYERWSDAVIQSLAAALFLDKDQLHFWEDIGYRHRFFYSHCPNNNSIWERCSCRPEQNFDNDSQSCLANFQQ
ncbi:alpha 1,2-mannosyltransferase 2.4.1 [Rhizopus stolonifer]|uniref:Alpha 1,2-mannosyltransferase 2.4.1 n=1 Tax=Rhizopus stolonifer TaxID=4846 RepID=A0A367KJ17_RHIST|nr:alpha 1,2-mannosyltransferase 2.4.1 [Rhizopus stolonifer]